MKNDSKHTLSADDHTYLWHPFTQQTRWTRQDPLIIERAEGCFLYDQEGSAYIDGVSSLWTNVHGHRNAVLDQALTEQLGRVAHSTFLGLSHAPGIQLAKALIESAPGKLQRVFYSDNGSTATEVALKMAYQYQQQRGAPQRKRFACLTDAYHGDTIGAVSVGGIDLFHEVYRPLLFDTVLLPAPVFPGGEEEEACLAKALALIEQHGPELAGVIVEPLVQGAAGMKMHSPHFLRTVLQAARDQGALVIADEVAVGFGRLGRLFAMEIAGFEPDFLCVAKGLSAGYLPLAATLATEAVYEAFLAAPSAYQQFFHGHTYTANPLACAVAIASLALFEENKTLEQVKAIEAQLEARFRRWNTLPHIAGIRHRGVMAGIDLRQPDREPLAPEQSTGHLVAMACRAHGAIIRPLGDTLVINPPLSISPKETTALLDAVERGVQDVLYG
jgi:adenosylmethionine---8-amino-7-oxononanoate aminotransferase